MTLDAGRIVAELKARAEALGFDAFGIAAADDRPDLPGRLGHALDEGWHAGMVWMAETADRRGAPRALWPEARSVIVLGMSYAPPTDPMARLDDSGLGNISVYARRRDYHEVIKGKLKELAGLLARRADARVKVFVDTAPVMEKPLGEAAGIGWQGKHSVLVSRRHGSFLFLGTIFTDAELPPDPAHPENCGTCTRCLDVCPTDAFSGPFRLDARKCLAYYNNEHEGQIPRAYRKPMGNRVFGCDDCVAVCPWNKFARATAEMRLALDPALSDTRLADLLGLDDAGFRSLFAGTPVKRLGWARFMRNCLVAAGNSGDEALIEPVSAHLEAQSPLVRGMAAWALGELASPARLAPLREKALGMETDPEVRSEWLQ
ncbi:tRNA epoxyqueuosine(34) reductase QueG [Pelagibacterium montanilacus]|uniref:tRNA epoxyqueuosine(34) reductase QueG n=1 Tax=Pelagibacterium montanilacus TaxID=2185280 RepID=UPI000F8F3614|nr:tRNA epoxyqueuosine(34) reductase QueG [Pelagibacterium montanilacus]